MLDISMAVSFGAQAPYYVMSRGSDSFAMLEKTQTLLLINSKTSMSKEVPEIARYVCRTLQNLIMAFVASTLWPKPLLNQNSRDMGSVYAGILFYSLINLLFDACALFSQSSTPSATTCSTPPERLRCKRRCCASPTPCGSHFCGPSSSTGLWGWRPPLAASSPSGSSSSSPTRCAPSLGPDRIWQP